MLRDLSPDDSMMQFKALSESPLLLTNREMQRIKEYIVGVSQPFFDMATEVMSLSLPTTRIIDGHVISEYSESVQAQLDEIERNRREAVDAALKGMFEMWQQGKRL